MPLQRRLPKRGFTSLTRAATSRFASSELDKLPVEEVDLLCSEAGRSDRCDALAAKVILSGKLSRKVTLKGVGATKGARRRSKPLAARLSIQPLLRKAGLTRITWQPAAP
jgi:large subunit ribosomal protein L15